MILNTLLSANSTEDYLYGVGQSAGIAQIERFSSIAGILIFVFNLAMLVGFSITLITVAWGFIQYIMSSGDPKALKTAFNTVVWSLSGILIILGSWAFKQIVLSTLGAQIDDIPNF